MKVETFIWIVSALLRYMRKNIFTPKCLRRSSELAFSHAANNVQLQLWTSAISGTKVETNSSFGSKNNRSPEMCTGLKVRVISLWMSILGLFLVNNLLLTILQKLYYFSNTSNLEKKKKNVLAHSFLAFETQDHPVLLPSGSDCLQCVHMTGDAVPLPVTI